MMAHEEFPSDEVLAAFIDGRADPETRKRVMEHMIGCDDCYATFEAATAMKATAHDRIVRFPPRRRNVVAIFAAAAAIAIVVVLVPFFRPKPLLTQLANASPNHRNVDGRLMDFPYQQRARTTRAATTAATEDMKLLAVTAKIQQEANAHPTKENLRALGDAYLLLGRWDQAIEALEKAKTSSANDPAILNDLSVAYYSRAKPDSNDLSQAANAAEEAWHIRKTPEIAWNRALAVKSQQSWIDYFNLAQNDPGIAEARALSQRPTPRSDLWSKERLRLAAAAKTGNTRVVIDITRRFPQQSRTWLEDELIPDWTDAIASDNAIASAAMGAAAHNVAAVLANEHRDPFLSQAVAVIESQQSNREALLLLREAHHNYKLGRISYLNHRSRDALVAFRKARDQFKRAHSPFASLAQVFESAALYYVNDYHASLETITTVAESESPPIAGMSLWIRGLNEAQIGRVYEAIGSLQAALSIWNQAAEPEGEFAVHVLLAGCYKQIGDSHSEWLHRGQALSIASSLVDPRRWSLGLEGLTDAASDAGLSFAARLYADQLVQNAKTIGSSEFMCNALLRRAKASALIGDSKSARQDIASARRFATMIPTAEIREKTAALITMADADVNGAGTLPDLDAAVSYAEGRDDHYIAANLLLKRAQARLGRSDLAGAEQDFVRGASEIEVRLNEADLTGRQYAFSIARTLFDGAVDSALRRGKTVAACAYADRFHRLLLDSSADASSRVLIDFREDSLQNRLPARTAVISYYSLQDRLVCWTFKQHRLAVFEAPITRSRLSQKIESLRNAIEADQSETILASRRALATVLIDPVQNFLSDVHTVVFVPDGDLWNVPFAALGGTTYLTEQFEIRLSPTISRVELRDAGKRDAMPSLVAFGNPSVDVRGLPALVPLAGAEREVSIIASAFRRTALFIGKNATKENFFRAASTGTFIHFASHAVVGTEPATAALILSGPAGQPDYLYAKDIAGKQLRGCNAVVLSACRTAVADSRKGVIVLANAFLAAGAQSVVGTLWDIDDQSTPRLMSSFYSGLEQGADPVHALRSAQLSAAKDGHSRLRDWAGFQIIAPYIDAHL